MYVINEVLIRGKLKGYVKLIIVDRNLTEHYFC